LLNLCFSGLDSVKIGHAPGGPGLTQQLIRLLSDSDQNII
jgi:hypothetical protein